MIRLRTRALFENHAVVVLVVLVFVGALLRLLVLGKESLWFDESISYLVARLPISSILDNTIQDPHPPLYYAMLHYWFRWLPQEVLIGRLLSAVWGIMLIPAVYSLAIEIFRSRRIAIFAALLSTFSPFNVLYSYEMRMYTWLTFLVTVQTLAYVKARRSAKNRWWLCFAVTTVCGLYTHLFSGLTLLGIGSHALMRHRNARAFGMIAGIGFCALLLFAPWIFILASEAGIGSGSLRPLVQDRAIDFNPFKPVTSLTFLIFGQSTLLWYVAVAFFLTLSAVVILIMEGNKTRREQTDHGIALPGLLVLANIGLPVGLYYLRPFFLPERTMAAGSPFLILLLAWGTARRGSPLPYLSIASFVAMAAGTILFLNGDAFKPPYRDAIGYVEQHRMASDLVLHTSDASYFPSLAYAHIPDHFLLFGDPEPRKPEQVVQALGGSLRNVEQIELEYDRIWLVVALEHSQEWQRAQADYIGGRFRSIDAIDLEGIQVSLYERKAE